MKIESVKDLGDLYLINNSTSIQKNLDNRFYRQIQLWISEGGIVQPEFSSRELLLNAQEAKKVEVNDQRIANMSRDILHKIGLNDYYFQRDILSQLAFINAIVSSEEIVVSKWVCSDNSVVNITKTDLISICSHIRERDAQEIYQGRKRKDAILALTKLEEVEAYDITTVYE